jgi:ATP-binding cassette, subfamily A (ABC1), member 3
MTTNAMSPVPIRGGNHPIQINNLCKSFGAFHAVSNLSLEIKEGEVFALLGHNGAGKTTTIQLITGMLKPTKGSAIIYGHDLETDLDGVRQSIGLCQQFDVLFDLLTCQEHLNLVCELKNIPANQKESEIAHILDIVMLREHKDKLSKNLSGGMKRKLSLAMALVGGSKLIILDEPTSGLDVESRRQVWALIKVIKQGRSIIMSS